MLSELSKSSLGPRLPSYERELRTDDQASRFILKMKRNDWLLAEHKQPIIVLYFELEVCKQPIIVL